MIKYVVKVDDRGTKYWTLNGEFHREDGPAIEYHDGSNYWYLNGKEIKPFCLHQHQTDSDYLVGYIEGLSKGVELAKKEMKQKIEEKLQLWEGEGFLEVYFGGEAVAASDIYDLITEEGTR